jgi:hypothetical protein
MSCNDFPCDYIVEIYVQAERKREESKKKPIVCANEAEVVSLVR